MASRKQKYEVYRQVEKRMVEVEGSDVEIGDYPNLFIHRPVDKKQDWMISEKITGRSISRKAQKTIPEAKEHAEWVLELEGRERFDEEIRRCVQAGLTTRWYRENGNF